MRGAGFGLIALLIAALLAALLFSQTLGMGTGGSDTLTKETATEAVEHSRDVVDQVNERIELTAEGL